MLEQLANTGADWSAAGALATMRTFYNSYRFREDDTESLYNPTTSLYFLDALRRQVQYPRRMLDENLAMDRNKLHLYRRASRRADRPARGGRLTSSFPNLASTIAVDFAAVADCQGQYNAALVFDAADQPIIADAIAPQPRITPELSAFTEMLA